MIQKLVSFKRKLYELELPDILRVSISPYQIKGNVYCYSSPILKILGVCQAEYQQYTYNDKRVKFIFASKKMHAVLW